MFGTLGFSELIIILVIVLVIFGAGRLPQLGEGLGKALKGFKKEVHDVPTPVDPNVTDPSTVLLESGSQTAASSTVSASHVEPPKPTAPYQPGPELTPGTTAALMASAAPQVAQPPRPKPVQPAASSQSNPVSPSSTQAQPPTMEDRMTAPAPAPQASYPPLPASAQMKPAAKRPSAIVNKDAVARVQAQQAAMKATAAQKEQPKQGQDAGFSSKDMQSLGESLGDTLRTFRQAAADVRNAVDPEMRTIRAEVDAAQKEIEQSIEAAKQMPVAEDTPKQG